MNTVQEKISKSSKLVALVLGIVCTLTAIMVALLIISLGILSFSNNALALSLQKAFAVFTSSGSVEIPSIETLMILFLFAIVQLLLLLLISYSLFRVFKNIKNQYTPFEEKQVVRLKKVAFLTLLMCIVSTIFDKIGHLLLYGTMSFGIDIIWLVLTMVIICLTHIFAYGCQLQKQSDETL